MKYEISLNKQEYRQVEVFAETPVEAIKLAEESNPGFMADGATEIINNDEAGDSYEVLAHCEACQVPILKYEDLNFDDEFGVAVCSTCLGK